MALWNVGSTSTHVGGVIGWSNITNISGTILDTMVEQEINFVNTYTNDNIGTSDIGANYQPVLVDLTLSKVLLSIEAQQGGVDSVSLGELSVSQGAGGNQELAKQLRTDAIARLQELGRSVRFTKIYGG